MKGITGILLALALAVFVTAPPAYASVFAELQNRCLPALEPNGVMDVTGLTPVETGHELVGIIELPDPLAPSSGSALWSDPTFWSGWFSASDRFAIAPLTTKGGGCEILTSVLTVNELESDWAVHVVDEVNWRESIKFGFRAVGDGELQTLSGLASQPRNDGFAVIMLEGFSSSSSNLFTISMTYAPKQSVFCRVWPEECT